jgi:hypothetical protein
MVLHYRLNSLREQFRDVTSATPVPVEVLRHDYYNAGHLLSDQVRPGALHLLKAALLFRALLVNCEIFIALYLRVGCEKVNAEAAWILQLLARLDLPSCGKQLRKYPQAHGIFYVTSWVPLQRIQQFDCKFWPSCVLELVSVSRLYQYSLIQTL